MTAEISHDPWATLDDMLGVEVVDMGGAAVGPVAFYGRCSTEDIVTTAGANAIELAGALSEADSHATRA